MGRVYAMIELINNDDLSLVRNLIIKDDQVRRMHVNMLVDSGAYMMAINETIQAQLQFPFVEKRQAQMADGSLMEFDVVGPIQVRFANRKAVYRNCI